VEILNFKEIEIVALPYIMKVEGTFVRKVEKGRKISIKEK
jgi:hypothetical protein